MKPVAFSFLPSAAGISTSPRATLGMISGRSPRSPDLAGAAKHGLLGYQTVAPNDHDTSHDLDKLQVPEKLRDLDECFQIPNAQHYLKPLFHRRVQGIFSFSRGMNDSVLAAVLDPYA